MKLGGLKRLIVWFLVLNLSLVYSSFGYSIETVKAESVGTLGAEYPVLSSGRISGEVIADIDSKANIILKSKNIVVDMPTGYVLAGKDVTSTYDYSYYVKRDSGSAGIEPPGVQPINTPYIYSSKPNFGTRIDNGNPSLNHIYKFYLLVKNINTSSGKPVFGYLGGISTNYIPSVDSTKIDQLTMYEPYVFDDTITGSGDFAKAKVRFKSSLLGKSFSPDKKNICSFKIKQIDSNNIKTVKEEYEVNGNSKCQLAFIDINFVKDLTVDLDVGSLNSKKPNYFYSELQYVKNPDDKIQTVLQSFARTININRDESGELTSEVPDAGTSLEQLEASSQKEAAKDAEECLGSEGPFNFFKKGLCAVMNMMIDIAVGISAWAVGYLQGAIDGL